MFMAPMDTGFGDTPYGVLTPAWVEYFVRTLHWGHLLDSFALSFPGIDHPKAVSGVDALLERKPVGQKMVIVGGGLVGCEIAYGDGRRVGNVLTCVRDAYEVAYHL